MDGDCWAAELIILQWRLKPGKNFQEKSSAPVVRSSPDWLEWKDFQRQSFEKYLIHWTDALHDFRPGIQLTSNWMYSSFAPRPVTAKLDFLSGDYSASLSVDRARFEARYLASTGWPWDSTAWGFDRGRQLGWSLKTPLHLEQEAAVVLMQGGGFEVYSPRPGGEQLSRPSSSWTRWPGFAGTGRASVLKAAPFLRLPSFFRCLGPDGPGLSPGTVNMRNWRRPSSPSGASLFS